MKRLVLSGLLVIAAFAISFGQAQQPVQTEYGGIMDVAKHVQLYPNPSVDEWINVKVESVKAEKIEISMHNIIGNPLQVESEVVSEHVVRVRVKDLSAGYYFLALRENESGLRGTYKFVKK
jgi:hypothetical protein